AGHLEVNGMMAVMAFDMLMSIAILKNAVDVFVEYCVQGITANEERCRQLVEDSMGLATALNPYIGYNAAAKVTQESYRTGKPIRQAVLDMGILSADALHR